MWTPSPEQIVTAEQKIADAAEAQRLIDFPNLEPDQFWFVVRASGHEGDLWEWVDSHQENDPLFWAAASTKLDYAKHFERDHPFVEAAREALGLTSQELDDLWKFGAQQ